MGNYYEPFSHAEEVWFWFCSSVATQNEGWRSTGDFGGKERCCEANDIYRIVKRMKFLKQISNRHLRVAYRWGMEMVSPYYDKRAKKSEIKLWGEMISALEQNLILKGIIRNEK